MEIDKLIRFNIMQQKYSINSEIEPRFNCNLMKEKGLENDGYVNNEQRFPTKQRMKKKEIGIILGFIISLLLIIGVEFIYRDVLFQVTLEWNPTL